MKRADDSRRGLRALNAASDDINENQRVSSCKCTLDVLDHRAGKRCANTNPGTERRDSTLARRIDEPFALEPAGKLGDLLPEDTLAGNGHVAGDKRQASGCLVDIELTGELDLQTILELKSGMGVYASPCDDAHRGAVVLDLEITVSTSRIRPAEAGDLARNRE